MRPVLEDALVDALGLTQVAALVLGDAIPENMVVAALDDIDGVDLDIAEMGNHGGGGLRSRSERLGRVEPLRAQPDAPGLHLAQGMGSYGSHADNLAGFAPPRSRPGTEK